LIIVLHSNVLNPASAGLFYWACRREKAPLLAGLSESALVGHGGITPLASCTQGPRDGIRAGSDQFRHAMVGADRVSLSKAALLLAVAGDPRVLERRA
jgi:hypothetical protein